MNYTIRCLLKELEPIKVKMNPLSTSVTIKEAEKISCSLIDHLDFKFKFDENKFLITLGAIAIGEAHNHNNLYYQKEEINIKLAEKISGYYDSILKMFILES